MWEPDDRSLKHLKSINPELGRRLVRVLHAMQVLGFPMTITSGIRTTAEQQALYAQGRTKPGKVVTQIDGVTKKSRHQDGVAADCAFLDDMGNPSWAERYPWDAYGACARAAGLKWGGDWKSFKDKPHVEL